MQFIAKTRYVLYSPYKLRLLVDVIRGKGVVHALNWLATYNTQRSKPIKKLIESATANARDLKNISASQLSIKEIRVDQGPIRRYFKPGAMGRAMPQRTRLSHLSVILEANSKEA